MKRMLAALPLLFAAGLASADEWGTYGRDPQNTRYVPLTRIAPGNVARLKPVWTFHTGDVSDGKNGSRPSGFETTPLMLDGRLYLTTPFNRIIALDPATGRQLWAYDPAISRDREYGDGFINRGLAAWRDGGADKACALRLFEATLDARLMAVDAVTGRPCAGFGANGAVDLRGVTNYRPGVYHMTSPPAVLDGVVVIGSSINDNEKADMPDGAVRGYDARSGKLLWQFQTLVKPAGAQGWMSGAANAWSVFTADPQRHLVFVPTGSASPDYYGGLRPGDDRWANSVVALDARTGRLVWGFQLVHHDLWDYDTAAPPLLTSIVLKGRATPALFVGNKTGMVYVLDPATGKPLLPVQERAVPPSTVPGEVASPTQPFSSVALARQTLTPADAWGRTEAERTACRDLLTSLGSTSLFTPPSLSGGLEIPGILGGINWSGFAWDGGHERLVVAVSNLPYRLQLIPHSDFVAGQGGAFRGERAAQAGTPYGMVRTPLMGPSGLPCVAPPWGELVSLDPVSGKIAWRRPLGTMADIFPAAADYPGSIILGGPIVTASGLIFSGGTGDRRLHALSSETGAELWSADLPGSAHAQPISYEIAGRQYVVIAAGGSAVIAEEAKSDAVIAYALP